MFFVDLCGVHISFRLPESHAGTDGKEICQPGGGDQILRSRRISPSGFLVEEKKKWGIGGGRDGGREVCTLPISKSAS